MRKKQVIFFKDWNFYTSKRFCEASPFDRYVFLVNLGGTSTFSKGDLFRGRDPIRDPQENRVVSTRWDSESKASIFL